MESMEEKQREQVVDEMNFSWAVQQRQIEWHKNSIYHNAGVTSNDTDMFFKGRFINDLPDLNLDIPNKKCSHNYYKLIQQSLV
jgi:hypothetical protein